MCLFSPRYNCVLSCYYCVVTYAWSHSFVFWTMVVVVVVGAGSVVFHCPLIKCVAGVMVSIVAFQAVDPGSIPGRRIFLISSMFDSVLFYSVAHQTFFVSFVTKRVSAHDSTEMKYMNTRHNNFKTFLLHRRLKLQFPKTLKISHSNFRP